MQCLTNRFDWILNIIVLSCAIVLLVIPTSGYAQIQPDQIGFPPDSNQIWILGIDTTQSSPTYGQGKWFELPNLAIGDTLPVIQDSCDFQIAYQALVEQHDIGVVVGTELHFNIPPNLDGWVVDTVIGFHTTAGTTGETLISVYNLTQAEDVVSQFDIDAGNTVQSQTGNYVLTSGDEIRIRIDGECTTPAQGLRVVLILRGLVPCIAYPIETYTDGDSLCIVVNGDSTCIFITGGLAFNGIYTSTNNDTDAEVVEINVQAGNNLTLDFEGGSANDRFILNADIPVLEFSNTTDSIDWILYQQSNTVAFYPEGGDGIFAIQGSSGNILYFNTATKALQFIGGSFTMDNIGAPTGSVINLIKDDTDESEITWMNGSYLRRWAISGTASADMDFRINRYTGSSAFQDSPISILNSDGVLVIPNSSSNPATSIMGRSAGNAITTVGLGAGFTIDGSGDIQFTEEVPINDLLAADGTNTIDNANFAQEWQWNTLSGSGLKLSSTSTAAASSNQRLFHADLSGANATGNEVTYAIYGSNSHTGTTPWNYGVYGQSTGSLGAGVRGLNLTGKGVDGTGGAYGGHFQGTIGVLGLSSASYGAWGASNTGTGILASSVSGAGLRSTGALPSNFNVAAAGTNDVVPIASLFRSSTGTPANGLGASLLYGIETSTTDDVTAGAISYLWSDITHASRTSRFELSTVNSGTTARKLAIAGDGQLTLDLINNFSGASTDSVVTVDASGNLRVRHAGLFGGAGDGWGSDIVNTDASLTGDGTTSDPLSVVFPVDTIVLKYIIEAWDIDVLTDLELRTLISDKYDLYEVIRVDAWHIEDGAVGGSTDIEIHNLTQTEAITTGLSITQGTVSDSVTGLTVEIEAGDQIQMIVTDECDTPGKGLEIDIYLVKQ